MCASESASKEVSSKLSFNDWKIKAIASLVRLGKKASDEGDERLLNSIVAVIVRLRNARRRDLATLLADLWEIYRFHKLPEVLDLIPTPEDIDRMSED